MYMYTNIYTYTNIYIERLNTLYYLNSATYPC